MEAHVHMSDSVDRVEGPDIVNSVNFGNLNIGCGGLLSELLSAPGTVVEHCSCLTTTFTRCEHRPDTLGRKRCRGSRFALPGKKQ